MRRSIGRALRICGAIIGAGFASGQELAAFFSRYGQWSWLGIAAAMVTLAYLGRKLCRCCMERSVSLAGLAQGKMRVLTRWMFCLLLFITGGAMLAGTGAIAALTLPLHKASWIGVGITLLFAIWIAHRPGKEMSWLSGGLMLLLMLILVYCSSLESEASCVLPTDISMPYAVVVCRGLCWGGFNLAVAAPLISEEKDEHAPLLAVGMLSILLLLGNAALLRHPSLMTFEVPLVQLLTAQGMIGYYGGALAIYLAMLTTLIAALRGLKELLPSELRYSSIVAAGGITLIALVGFAEIIDFLYPLLGGGCLVVLILLLRKNDRTARI